MELLLLIHLLQIFLLHIKQLLEQYVLQLIFLQYEHCLRHNKHNKLLHVEQFIKQFLQYFLLHSEHNIRHELQ